MGRIGCSTRISTRTMHTYQRVSCIGKSHWQLEQLLRQSLQGTGNLVTKMGMLGTNAPDYATTAACVRRKGVPTFDTILLFAPRGARPRDSHALCAAQCALSDG
jgi:hypothetical protein